MTDFDIKQWFTEVLEPTLLSKQDLGPPEKLTGGGIALLSADTDRTQSFVFQSGRLTEIRGASNRLDQLNRRDLLNILEQNGLSTNSITADKPGCVIFCGGGSLLALIPANLAEKLVEEIEALYPRETGTATITAVYQPVSAAEVRGQLPSDIDPQKISQTVHQFSGAEQQRILQSYGVTSAKDLTKEVIQQQQSVARIMRQQNFRLRQRKQSKEKAPLIEASPFVRRCQSCGRRPTIDFLQHEGETEARPLCAVCFENGRQGSGKVKGYWRSQFEKHTNIELGEPVKDLSVIGAQSNRYIGYIYTDGNSIGKLLENQPSFMSYSQLSQALQEKTEAAVYESLQEYLYDDGKMKPFEIITIGGDDVMLITPARFALPIARLICLKFQEKMASPDLGNRAPTMSAGVVLAQENNPIYFLQDLAAALLKNAKRGTRHYQNHKEQSKEPCIDFMVLKSQSTLATQLKDVRTSSVLMNSNEQQTERVYLTGRPYTLNEIDLLLKSTKSLGEVNFSPGQLHEMRRQFQNGRLPGLFFYLYQRKRVSNRSKDHANKLNQIEIWWQMDESSSGAAPWRTLGQGRDDYQEFDTPLIDMLGLLEFVKEVSNGNSD